MITLIVTLVTLAGLVTHLTLATCAEEGLQLLDEAVTEHHLQPVHAREHLDSSEGYQGLSGLPGLLGLSGLFGLPLL